jgi:hypothetical protein
MNIKKILNDIKEAFLDIILIWIYVLDLSLLIVIIDYFKPDLIYFDIVFYSGLFLGLHLRLVLEIICNFLIWISVI